MHTPAISVHDPQRSTIDEPRWVSLWRALGSARRELVQRRARSDSIEQAFTQEIEPRERQLTASVLALTLLLIDRYRQLVLDDASRALLALWISDNLERLHEHPFAQHDAVARVRRTWRGVLTPDEDVQRRHSPATNARPSAPLPDDESARRHETNRRDRYGRPTDAEPGPCVDRLDIDAMLPGADDDGDLSAQRLVDRLFRRLAQSLHPDREPDAAQRELKQSLMRAALTARGALDLDTLLSLHVEHVGEPLGGLDTHALEKALARQLEGMRRALQRLRYGDPLRRRIIERYDAQDKTVRDLLVHKHAAQIDLELERLTQERTVLTDDDGDCAALHTALEVRRERELDRLAIDELTGVT